MLTFQRVAACVALGRLLLTCAASAEAATGPATFVIPTVVPAVPLPIDGRVAGTAWTHGAHIRLEYELTYRKGVGQDQTDVYVYADSTYLYVGFACKQSEQIISQQLNDDVGLAGDDNVEVVLWPGGASGVRYRFAANPRGVHNALSSENAAFAPKWASAGHLTPSGFEVTMRIPLSVLHGDGRADWLVQFDRWVIAPQKVLAWSYNAAMQSDPATLPFVGTFRGIGKVARVAQGRAQPRIQVYGLGEVAAPRIGGPTSRAGIDYSIPVGHVVSFYGTIHPDYSNVEQDQESIAPTEFPRYFTEVRPFFTQAQGYFNSNDLYTPSIPTPRYGYAAEGTADNFGYAGFNAIGDARDDNAETIRYVAPNQRVYADYQRTAVEMPGFFDTTQSAILDLSDAKHFDVFAGFGEDDGTRVANPTQNKQAYIGGDFYAANEGAGFKLLDSDSFYNPYDGRILNPDIHGYSAYLQKTWQFGSNAKLRSVAASTSVDGYHNIAGATNQTDDQLVVTATTRHNLSLTLSSSSSHLLVPGFGLVPFNQSGMAIMDAANPGATVSFQAEAGHFLNGFQRYYTTSEAVKAGVRLTFTFEADLNDYTSPMGWSAQQTLMRLAATYQFGPSGSMSVGVRRIDGSPASFSQLPAGRDTNLSFALSERLGHEDLYVVYGDPNSLNTTPQFIVKLVHYIEGERGT